MRMSLFTVALAVILSTNRAGAADAEKPDAPGLTLVVERRDVAPSLPADARIARTVALYVPQGSPPSDFTAPGPFRATFRGDLNLRLRSYVRFHAEGRGKFTLTLNGAAVLETSGDDLSRTVSNEIRLNKGKNQLVATYESPASGDASLRLFWSSKSFAPEPLPPMLLSRAAPDAATARSLQAREGQFLIAQLRCTKCHLASGVDAKAGMPELAMDAPDLTDVGARLSQNWLAAWIQDPRALRPDAHMPRVVKDVQSAADVAAYLSSLGSPSTAGANGNAEAGGRLYANLDCIACHTTPDAPADDPTRVPHNLVAAKFTAASLKAFLLKPTAHYAWSPMPDFHLSDAEAEDLTAFLRTGGKPVTPALPGDVGRGKQLVASAGCLNCHTLGSETAKRAAPALDSLASDTLGRGCLGADTTSRGRAPDFALQSDQRAAIATFLSTDRTALTRTCAPEFAERQITAMRCTACHARDGNESLLAQALDAQVQALRQKYPNPPPAPGELLAAEQKPPMLTYAGGKLRPDWMEQFIGGKITYKPRYFLRARMPASAARAKLLAAGIAQGEGCPPALPPNPKPDANLAEAGRKLAGKVPNVGFSCTQCHAAADVPPFAAFEAPSINFKYVAERLRHDYYFRWMHDPLRIDPASKMPRFDDAEGKTGLPAFGNDAKQQFEAIWQYLLEGESIRPPQ